MTTFEDEIGTLAKMCELLEPLDIEARERMLDYLMDRFVSEPRRSACVPGGGGVG